MGVLFRLKHKIQQTCFVDIGQRHQKFAKMKIYEDVFTGDEMFSDTYPIKLVENCLWELTGKHISRSQDDIQLEGSNASAEEADEGTGVLQRAESIWCLTTGLSRLDSAARRTTLST